MIFSDFYTKQKQQRNWFLNSVCKLLASSVKKKVKKQWNELKVARATTSRFIVVCLSISTLLIFHLRLDRGLACYGVKIDSTFDDCTHSHLRLYTQTHKHFIFSSSIPHSIQMPLNINIFFSCYPKPKWPKSCGNLK